MSDQAATPGGSGDETASIGTCGATVSCLKFKSGVLLREFVRDVAHTTATGKAASHSSRHGPQQIVDGLVAVGSDAHIFPAIQQLGDDTRRRLGLAGSRRTLNTERGCAHRGRDAESRVGGGLPRVH